MIRIAPYRRPRLTDCDGQPGLSAISGVIGSLACHKGDASQQQENEEQGAQTGGNAIKGTTSGAVNTTGNQIVVNPGGGSGFSLFGGNTGTTKTVNNSTINSGLDPVLVEQALTQLAGAFSQNQEDAVNAVASVAAPAVAAATAPATTSTATSGGVDWNTIWQIAASIAVVAGTVYVFVSRKKNS